jgi:hypothetical protein
MTFIRTNDQRKDSRVDLDLPAQISIGSQLTLQGKLKDLSLKSAFVVMKNSVYLKTNDEVGFAIQVSPGNPADVIEGLARVSRIAVGEGLAIYFTKMDGPSEARLRELFK